MEATKTTSQQFEIKRHAASAAKWAGRKQRWAAWKAQASGKYVWHGGVTGDVERAVD